jgi:hypothetical protein
MRQALAAALLFLAYGMPEAWAEGDRIWSALVLATKENPPSPIPDTLERFAPAIKKIFGYNSLYLLGEKKRDLISGGEEWLVPSKEFFFKVQCLSQEPTCYSLRIELYRDKSLLLTTEAKLAKNAPLYIRGPAWGSGHLIFLLEVR